MCCGGLGALGFEFFRGAEAAIGFALGQQPRGVLCVDGEALGLTIGAVVALVGFEALWPGPSSQSMPSQ